MLRRGFFGKARSFFSIPTETTPSCRKISGGVPAWLDHSTHTGGTISETSPGPDSKCMQHQDEARYPGRFLDIINRFRYKPQPLDWGLFLVLSNPFCESELSFCLESGLSFCGPYMSLLSKLDRSVELERDHARRVHVLVRLSSHEYSILDTEAGPSCVFS